MSTPFSAESLPLAESEASQPAEFEFVLGRRQIASVSLVGLTALAIFTGAAYVIGKSAVPPPKELARPIQIIPPAIAPASLPQLPAPKTELAIPDPPVFGTPEKGRLYLQLGSLERGFAVLMVHGARKVGFHAIVAEGTNPNVFRVLVGPFETQAEYQTGKAMFVSMGLDTFARKYGQDQETRDSTEP